MQKAIHGITVAHFYETYREKLKLELVTGEAGMHRLIREGSINRPALALTGFFKYFANKRIQVIGAAEMTYLKTRSQQDQIQTFREMVKRSVPCVVLTRNFHPTHAMSAVASEMNLPILRTPLITMNLVNLATLCIDNEFAPSGIEHATTLDVRGVGVLLRGDSGVGKSDLALRAIDQGFRMVADDRTLVFLSEGRLFGSAPSALFGLMEIRGVGIVGCEALRFAPVSLAVRCKSAPDAVERLPDPASECFLGFQTPAIDLWPLEDSAPAKIRRAIEHLGARP